MKTKSLAIFFVFFLSLFLLTDFAMAAESTKTGEGIVPCGKGDSDPCTLCHLIVGIQNLINWGTTILITLAILGIVIAGIIYIISSGNEKLMSSAKSALRASLIGFAVFLAAWLIVNSVIFWLLSAKSDLGIGASGGWSKFTCDTSSSGVGKDDDKDEDEKEGDPDKLAECNKWCNDNKATGNTEEANKYNSECLSGCSQQFGPNGKPDPNGTGMNGTEAKQALDKCGVSAANVNTLNGVQDTTVNEICKFEGASKCGTYITSGTSGTHKTGSSCTHENGCKFDFRPNSCNDSWIESNYGPSTGTRSDGAKCYPAPSGACYAREGNHWDMSTTRSCKAQGC